MEKLELGGLEVRGEALETTGMGEILRERAIKASVMIKAVEAARGLMRAALKDSLAPPEFQRSLSSLRSVSCVDGDGVSQLELF